MILVTVGTHTQGFTRLIKKMDEIAGKIDEEVVMQIGATEYAPHNARYFRFVSQDEMELLNRKANLVVTHAGAGSILTALTFGKPVIVIPRLARYEEVIDDHQLQLTKVLSEEDRVIAVYSTEDLEYALSQVIGAKGSSTSGNESKLIQVLRDYADSLESPKKRAAKPDLKITGG